MTKPHRRPFFKSKRTLSLPVKQRNFEDLSEDEIERRYQAALRDIQARSRQRREARADA